MAVAAVMMPLHAGQAPAGADMQVGVVAQRQAIAGRASGVGFVDPDGYAAVAQLAWSRRAKQSMGGGCDPVMAGSRAAGEGASVTGRWPVEGLSKLR